MTAMPISKFFDRMEQAYRDADFDTIARCFVLPGGIYIGENVIVLGDFQRLSALLKDQCRRNYDKGVRRVSQRLIGQTLGRENNYSAWVQWDHFGEKDEPLGSFNARYVCRDSEQGEPMIQLVELLNLPPWFSENELIQMADRKRRAS